jgi:hypothetical protein
VTHFLSAEGFAKVTDGQSCIHRLDGCIADGYPAAVAEVDKVDGEAPFTHRMRVMSYPSC